MIARADAIRLPLETASVNLCMGSPPYLDARLYLEGGKDIGIARQCAEWIAWMLRVTEECLRVSRGLVIWVCAGKTKDWTYQPGPEGLAYEWWKRGGSQFRPCYWNRVGIPGSGGTQWYRSDVEYVLAFKRPGKLPYANPTANGHPPKWAPGGEMSHRVASGKRINAFGVGRDGIRVGGIQPNGRKAKTYTPVYSSKGIVTPESAAYQPTVMANPGNFVHTKVGGQLGTSLAYESEAPYPEELPRWFIESHCPPGGIVLDPFGGSGSTVAAALSIGRRGLSFDLRQSQCLLARRRLKTVNLGFAFADEPTPLTGATAHDPAHD